MATPDELTDAITRLLVEAAPTLTFTAVRTAVATVLRKPAHADRLLAALAADPMLPTGGSAGMPRALQRIIAAIDAPGSGLRLPVCPGCDREMASALVASGSRWVCGSCGKRAGRRPHPCAECGTEILNPRRAAGRTFCIRCWHALRPRRVDILLPVVGRTSPSVGADAVGHALRAASASETEQLRLVLDCVVHGDDWFRRPERGSAAFARMYTVLAENLKGLPPLLCAVCREDRPLSGVIDGGRVCRRCYQDARKATCDNCDQIRTISRRLPDGTRLCQWCFKSAPDQRVECASCQQRRVVAVYTADGPLCTSCRLGQAVGVCTKCGRAGPCRFAGTSRAVCEDCRRTRLACNRCGAVKLVHTRDDDGNPLCGSCSERPTAACTTCGKLMAVVGRADGQPLCGTCYKKHPASFGDCARCGVHRRIRRTGLCDACTTRDLAASMFPAAVLDRHPRAAALRDALMVGRDDRNVTAFLRSRSLQILRAVLGSDAPISHATIDEMGTDQATRHVCALLVEYRLLEPVDEHIRRFEAWIPAAAAVIIDPRSRAAFTQYANWKHLRELRAMPSPVPASLAGSRRRELRFVIDLLTWAEQHGIALVGMTQEHVDHWSAAGSERYRAHGFLRWAHRNKLAANLSILRRRSPAPLIGGIPDKQRHQLLARVLADDGIIPGTKLAAALVLLYGIRPHRIARITLDQVDTVDGLARIRLGAEHLYLPTELGIVAEAVIAARTARRLLHDVSENEWLFPGSRPGWPLANTTLARRLARIGVQATPARRGALTSLAASLHPVVLADLTGIHIRTAITWRDAVAASRSRYVAERSRDT